MDDGPKDFERDWLRRVGETAAAFAAFEHYDRLGARRSIREAYRASKGLQQGVRISVPGNWSRWSIENEWVARTLAHDLYLAEEDAAAWDERRRLMRERDWAQGDTLRTLFDESVRTARMFVTSSTDLERGYPTIVDDKGKVIRQGRADRQVITMAFSIVDLARVLLDGTKLQRLSTDQPTENINNLSGAALDALIDRELDKRLAELANGSQTANAPTSDDGATNGPNANR